MSNFLTIKSRFLLLSAFPELTVTLLYAVSDFSIVVTQWTQVNFRMIILFRPASVQRRWSTAKQSIMYTGVLRCVRNHNWD